MVLHVILFLRRSLSVWLFFITMAKANLGGLEKTPGSVLMKYCDVPKDYVRYLYADLFSCRPEDAAFLLYAPPLIVQTP